MSNVGRRSGSKVIERQLHKLRLGDVAAEFEKRPVDHRRLAIDKVSVEHVGHWFANEKLALQNLHLQTHSQIFKEFVAHSTDVVQNDRAGRANWRVQSGQFTFDDCCVAASRQGNCIPLNKLSIEPQQVAKQDGDDNKCFAEWNVFS